MNASFEFFLNMFEIIPKFIEDHFLMLFNSDKNNILLFIPNNTIEYNRYYSLDINNSDDDTDSDSFMNSEKN